MLLSSITWSCIALTAALVVKSMHTGLTGSGQVNNRGSLGAFVSNENAEGTAEPLIGRKVWTRWPEDNSFYEAVITDYNHAEVCSITDLVLL